MSGSSGIGNNTLSNEVVVDALPYIDLGYDEPGVREAVSTSVAYKQRTRETFLCKVYQFSMMRPYSRFFY